MMEADSEYVMRLQLQLPEVDPVNPVLEEDEEDSDPIDSAEDESEYIGDGNQERDEEFKASHKGGNG